MFQKLLQVGMKMSLTYIMIPIQFREEKKYSIVIKKKKKKTWLWIKSIFSRDTKQMMLKNW